ncbi:hypothetical protein Fot_37577 [Forsythia ovata]|uniref:Uncharacterized protein n=1 Tax=Forsythia ovata TaxID=205694 RepID=A0ABD1RZD6_9LAMI
MAAPKRAMEEEDDAGYSMRAKRSRETPPRKIRENTSSRGTSRTSIPFLHGWTERINIGSRQDKFDPAILGNLPSPYAIVIASVHKYWTSAWAKATDNVDLLKLLKLAKMNTSRSHILNCELYKVLEMKIDRLHSTVMGAEDIDELHSKNKILRLRLAVFEDTRVQAEYRITKAETIQMFSIKAQKQAELKLKVCEDMAHAKHKELMEALAELSKAKELLAKLGVSSHTDPKGLAET